MTYEEHMVELTRVTDPIEADLLAAFLDNNSVEFQMSKSAQTMSTMVPSGSPIVFMVFEEHLGVAKEAVDEYIRIQKASIPPDDAFDETEEPK